MQYSHWGHKNKIELKIHKLQYRHWGHKPNWIEDIQSAIPSWHSQITLNFFILKCNTCIGVIKTFCTPCIQPNKYDLMQVLHFCNKDPFKGVLAQWTTFLRMSMCMYYILGGWTNRQHFWQCSCVGISIHIELF